MLKMAKEIETFGDIKIKNFFFTTIRLLFFKKM